MEQAWLNTVQKIIAHMQNLISNKKKGQLKPFVFHMQEVNKLGIRVHSSIEFKEQRELCFIKLLGSIIGAQH